MTNKECFVTTNGIELSDNKTMQHQAQNTATIIFKSALKCDAIKQEEMEKKNKLAF